MGEVDKLAADETRRGLQYEAAKSAVEAEVVSEIVDRADKATPSQAKEIENIAGEFRSKALTEVAYTKRESG